MKRREGDPVVATGGGTPYWPSIPNGARPFFVGALLIGAIWYFMGPLEFLAVHSACRRDGGVSIRKTDDVDGYWHGGYRMGPGFDGADCLLCAEQVAAGDFSYVEFERTTVKQEQTSGFVRFELAEAGDPACDATIVVSRMPAGKCVAVHALSGRPISRYRFRSELVNERGLLGATIRERSEVVVDASTNQPIASLRFFDAATPAEHHGGFARSYACDAPAISPTDENAFLRAVLKVRPEPPPRASAALPGSAG